MADILKMVEQEDGKGWRPLRPPTSQFLIIYNINKPSLVNLLSTGYFIICILKDLSRHSYVM